MHGINLIAIEKFKSLALAFGQYTLYIRIKRKSQVHDFLHSLMPTIFDSVFKFVINLVKK